MARLIRRRRGWAWLVLGALAFVLGACRRDAQEYARQFHVSLPEAVERLRYQEGIGRLNAALQANEKDTFAGLWIQHEPDYRVIVAFAGDGGRQQGVETLRPYVEGQPFAHLVEVREARYTLAELEAIQAEALRELDKLDFDMSCTLNVQDNRIEVPVTDRAWVESELRKAGAQLPEGVELVVVGGGSTARDRDLLLTPPVPGISLPRQKPVEGVRTSMLAELVGTLRLEEGCLRVSSLPDGEVVLPIWPPEFTLRVEGDQVLVIDGQGQVAARAGEEVYMGGGHVPVTDEWVLQQIPPACRGSYFVVGNTVRPNLRQDAELLSTEVISMAGRTILFPRYEPALDEQVTDRTSIGGKLVAYDYRRCLHLQTEWGPGVATLLWPPDWSVRVDGDAAVVVDGTGQDVARLGDEVLLRARAVPQTMDSPVYRQLIDELPGDCVGATWLVDGIQ
jgi:hypothetical protein